MNPEAGAGRGNSPTLEEVRSEIDSVDLQIIELLGQRAELVRSLGKLKKGRLVRDPERERKVLEKVRGMALDRGLSPDFVEKVYRIFFSYFTELQQVNGEQR